MWRALKIFVEEELADDVAGPVHDNNQHAEVVSGPVITLGVQSETSCFTITLLERLTKIVMAKFGEPLKRLFIFANSWDGPQDYDFT